VLKLRIKVLEKVLEVVGERASGGDETGTCVCPAHSSVSISHFEMMLALLMMYEGPERQASE